jgi:hypothetical protein
LNYVILSPHFPTNYCQFYVHLRALGANVLGIADEPYDNLNNELKSALSEYYYVPNMHNYDDLVRAMGYLTYRWGKIDGLDSHSEYWMETEAMLRTDFNIEGMKLVDLPAIKRKSLMKKIYKKAGVESAPGIVVRSAAAARHFAREIGFPLIAKPDIGVGAANTYRFDNQEQLETFLSTLPPIDYFLEKFIEGRLVTFDGLTDQNGDIVFCNSMEFSSGILEAVNEDTDLFYYTLRKIPSDLEEAGRRVVRAYNIRKRFFHLEFFRTEVDKLYGLEVNMRPPGGLTTDMFNYANDFDIYYEWANIIVHNRFSANYSRPYFCAYIGRKRNMHYLHSHKEIMGQIGKQVVQYEEISGIFAKVFGNYGYIVRSTKLDEIHAMVNYIQEKVTSI